MIPRTVFVAAAILTIVSCEEDNTPAAVSCDGVSISFSSEVLPLIQTNCAASSGCHASGSTRGPGALLTYAQIFSARNSIKQAVSTGAMPQGAFLSSDQKNKIICWIENGAENN